VEVKKLMKEQQVETLGPEAPVAPAKTTAVCGSDHAPSLGSTRTQTLLVRERVAGDDLDFLAEHEGHAEGVDCAHRVDLALSCKADAVRRRLSGEGVGDEDLARRGILVDEVLAGECRHRLFNVEVEAGGGIDELFDSRPSSLREGAQDPAVELALCLAEPAEALASCLAGPASDRLECPEGLRARLCHQVVSFPSVWM
jgi:hypothetical protein